MRIKRSWSIFYRLLQIIVALVALITSGIQLYFYQNLKNRLAVSAYAVAICWYVILLTPIVRYIYKFFIGLIEIGISAYLVISLVKSTKRIGDCDGYLQWVCNARDARTVAVIVSFVLQFAGTIAVWRGIVGKGSRLLKFFDIGGIATKDDIFDNKKETRRQEFNEEINFGDGPRLNDLEDYSSVNGLDTENKNSIEVPEMSHTHDRPHGLYY